LKKTEYGLLLSVMALILLLEMFLALGVGSVRLEKSKIFDAVMHGVSNLHTLTEPGQGPVHDIVWLLRMPRLILAAVAGAGLAVCGVVMQAIVKNPLADPYILGISSGAFLGATVSIFFGVGLLFGSNYVGVCAFLGALSISLLVLVIANIGSPANSIKLLLAGMALNTACSAISSFIVYFANDKEGMQTVMFWLMGSFAGANWSDLSLISGVALVGVLLFWSQSRMLNLMLFGDQTAITLGTDLRKYRQTYLFISSIMIGFIVYASGMIGFVGLVVPHIVRMIEGTNHNRLIPLAALVGAMLLVLADTLCRSLIPRTEIPVGILISLVGAPCFVFLIAKKTYGLRGGGQ